MFKIRFVTALAFLLVLITQEGAVVSAPRTSDYRKYLRTRQPQHNGEVHVEEVLEVFKSKDRPPAHGVYNKEVNGFLANDYFQRRKATTTTAKPAVLTTTKVTTESTGWNVQRTTYPTPNGNNENPDYTYPFKPVISVSVTKYPGYQPPKTIIIQEGANGDGERQTSTSSTSTTTEKQLEEETTEYDYSNEEYFNQ